MSQPVQISLVAELREALFREGIMRNRCVALSNESHELNERNKVLDQDNQTLRNQLAELQADMRVVADRADMVSGE